MIMRNALIFITILMALNCHPGTLFAQRVGPTDAGLFKIRTPVLPIDDLPAGNTSLKNRILTGLAGAVLGAGIGYFASQVATGSWDEGQGKSIVHRPTWAAIGGAGGLVLGFSLPFGGGSAVGGSPFPGGDGRYLITREQILDAQIFTALEAVKHFHPEWLVLRGSASFSDGPDVDDVRAYLDNVPLGDVNALATFDTSLIEYIRFFDSRRATARWGMSHPHGAIQIITLGKGGAPR
jgi:hypothetical protein